MKCPKCNRGPLIPERDLNGKVQSIGCLNCGHRVFRDFEIRHPTVKDLGDMRKIVKPQPKNRRQSHVKATVKAD